MVDEDTTPHTHTHRWQTCRPLSIQAKKKKHIDLKTGLSYYGFSN